MTYNPNNLTTLPSTGMYRNAIINGNFDIWQRGDTSSGSDGYTADHVYLQTDGGADATMSKVTVAPNIFRGRATKNGSGVYDNVVFPIENGRNKFKGKTVTFCFHAVGSTSFSSTVDIRYTNIGYGGNTLGSSDVTITTSEQRFYVTVAIPDTYEETYINLIAQVGFQNVGVGGYVDIWDAQLYEGDADLPCSPRSKVEELVLCKRYFERIYPAIADTRFGSAAVYTSTVALALIHYDEKRIVPTLSYSTASYFGILMGGSAYTLDSITNDTINTKVATISAGYSTGGMTVGDAGSLYASNAAAYIDINAEL